jgi:hypothetical protein
MLVPFYARLPLALADGVAPPTPWRLLLASDDDDVKALVDELMEKSPRLKRAAIAPENMRAAAAGLRVPKPQPPFSEKERAELEKKSDHLTCIPTP